RTLDAMDLIPLLQEKFSEVGSVLSGDSSDEGFLQAACSNGGDFGDWPILRHGVRDQGPGTRDQGVVLWVIGEVAGPRTVVFRAASKRVRTESRASCCTA